MAYTQKHMKFEDEEYPSNDEFCPDKSFIEAWEDYLADEDLEEEMEAFRCARGRFMDLVVKGPLAAEWMRQQAHWYLWAAEQEDELSHSHSQSPSLTHEKEVTSPSLSHQEVEDSDELNMPGEAEEYAAEEDSGGAVSAPDDMGQWDQENWDDFYASQGPSHLEEVEQEEPAAASENGEDFYQSYLPSYLEEVEQEAPDEAEEYVEDPTVLEEDDWAAFQSWKVPPDKVRKEYAGPPDEAREQYAGPSRAVERGSSLPRRVSADRPPWVWSDGLTWEQVGGAPLRAAPPSNFIAGQQAAWDARPGVPMDTSAGRTRMRTANTSAHTRAPTVCHSCKVEGHTRAACPLGGKIRARPSRVQVLQLRASRFRGQNPRNGGNVTNLQGPPSERTPEEKLWDFKTRAQQYARDRASCDDTRISYLEFLETEAEDDLALARMIAG
jgi:hypothetical protein